MPIRFRCAYCNQLMGIARRKAGTVVRCPTCGGQVIVPPPPEEASPPARPPGRPGNKPAAVFEQSDFEKVFDKGGEGSAWAAGAAVAARGSGVGGGIRPPASASAGAGEIDVEPVALHGSPGPAPAAPERGLLLTPVKMTLLSLLIVLLVGLAFLAGVIVGRSV